MRAWSGPQINPLTKCQQVLAKSPLVLAGVAEGNSHNNVPAVAGAYPSWAKQTRDPLQQNSPSCGNQPANIRLDNASTKTRSPPQSPRSVNGSGAPGDGRGRRFPLPT